MLGGATPELAVSGRRLMALMVDAKLLRAELEIEGVLAPDRSRNCRNERRRRMSCELRPLTMRFPASLKLTVPLILLGFAAILSTVNLLYHVPQAERAAEEDSRKRLAQEMSRLQSTLEYLLLKGDLAAAQHEIAVLAHNHEVIVRRADRRPATTSSRRRAARGWGGRSPTVLPQFDLEPGRAARSASAAPA